MSKASLGAIVRYCDQLLRTARVQDYERAANGLQVENRGGVARIAAAVDATLATVRMAAAAKANLLLVYHGLFGGPAHPWTGKRHELIRRLIEKTSPFTARTCRWMLTPDWATTPSFLRHLV